MNEDIDSCSFSNLLSMKSALSVARSLCHENVVNEYFEGDFEYKAIVMPIVKSSSLRGES